MKIIAQQFRNLVQKGMIIAPGSNFSPIGKLFLATTAGGFVIGVKQGASEAINCNDWKNKPTSDQVLMATTNGLAMGIFGAGLGMVFPVTLVVCGMVAYHKYTNPTGK